MREQRQFSLVGANCVQDKLVTVLKGGVAGCTVVCVNWAFIVNSKAAHIFTILVVSTVYCVQEIGVLNESRVVH